MGASPLALTLFTDSLTLAWEGVQDHTLCLSVMMMFEFEVSNRSVPNIYGCSLALNVPYGPNSQVCAICWRMQLGFLLYL